MRQLWHWLFRVTFRISLIIAACWVQFEFNCLATLYDSSMLALTSQPSLCIVRANIITHPWHSQHGEEVLSRDHMHSMSSETAFQSVLSPSPNLKSLIPYPNEFHIPNSEVLGPIIFSTPSTPAHAKLRSSKPNIKSSTGYFPMILVHYAEYCPHYHNTWYHLPRTLSLSLYP